MTKEEAKRVMPFHKEENKVLVVYYDKVSKEYTQVLTFNNVNSAKRWFQTVLAKSDFDNNDYNLYKIGEYDKEDGVLVNIEKEPVLLMKGVNDCE